MIAAWLKRRWLPLLLGTVLVYIGLAVHHRVLLTFINGEDCLWIRGDDFGWTDRTVQRWLLQQLYPAHLGPSLEPLYMLAMGLHLLIALQLYALFVRLPPALGLASERASLHLAGATAGLLYVLFHSTNLGYLSALSYQLCTLLFLAGLTVALAYLARPRLHLWLLLAGLFWLGLKTHPFIYSLPLLVALLELTFHRTVNLFGGAGGGGVVLSWRKLAPRYGLLALVLGGHLALHLDTLTNQWARRPDPPPFTLLGEPAQIYAFFASPLAFFWQRLAATNLPALDNPRVLATPLPGALAMLVPLVLVLGLVTVGVIWLRRLQGGRPAGFTGAAFLLLTAWNLLTYWQVRHAPMVGEPSWRYEITVAGYCLLAVLAALVLAGRLLALVRDKNPAGLPGALLFIPLTCVVLFASRQDQLDLVQVIFSDASMQNPGSCPVAGPCLGKESRRMTRAEVEASTGSLACADLHGLDLQGLDLRGRDLAGANLSGAKLDRARLDRSELRGACLNWGRLAGANLSGADLTDARLVGAVLVGANLCGAKIQGLKDACASELVVEARRRCPTVDP